MSPDAPRDTGSEPRTEAAGYRLDALLDELVAAGWSGEFDARERAALNRLGWVRAETDDRLARVVEALRDTADSLHRALRHHDENAWTLCMDGPCPITRRTIRDLAIPVPDRPAEPVLERVTKVCRVCGHIVVWDATDESWLHTAEATDGR